MAHASDIRLSGLNIAGRFETFRADLAERLERRRVYRTTLNELSALSSRELADLGLHHSQLRRIALEAAYKV